MEMRRVGAAIAGATVGYRTEWVDTASAPLMEATSDARGRFVLSNAPGHDRRRDARGVVLSASAPDYAQATRAIPQPREGESAEAELRVRPAAIVRGRVVDASGHAVSGASVSVNAGGGVPSRATSGADGRFAVDDVPAARAETTAVKLSFTSRDGAATVRSTASVRAGSVTDTGDVVLPERCFAEFLVVDPEGKPVWGADVSNEPLPMRGRTDSEGRLRLAFPYKPAFLTPFPMAVRAPGFAPALTPHFVPSIESPPLVRLVLGPARRVSGKVVLPDGRPAVDATVTVGNGSLPLTRVFPTHRRIACGGEVQPARGPVVRYAEARVGADGSFEICDLPEGPFHLKATRPVRTFSQPKHDLAYLFVEEDEATIAADPAVAAGVASDATGVRLTVPADDAGPPPCVLEGSILDRESGRPLHGASAELIGPDRSWNAESVSVGRFRFPPLPAGTYTLRCRADGYVGLESLVELNESTSARPLAVRLERGASVRGIVRGPAGVDLTNATLSLRPIEGDRSGAASWIASDGSYRVSGLVAGRYRVTIERTDPYWDGPSLAGSRLIVIDASSPEGDHDGDVEMVLAGTLNVKVAATVRPIPFRVQVRNASGDIIATWRDSTGDRWAAGAAYRVPPGRYTVRLETDGADPVETETRVEPGMESTAWLSSP